MTHIIVLTPSLGRVSVAREETWGNLVLECHRRGIKLSRNDASDPGLLPHARNVLLAAAVESDATHAFWWDADVAFDVECLFELLDRPEAMICRPYPMRGTDWESVRNYLMDRDGVGVPSPDELRNASMLWSTSIHYENGKPVWSEDGKLLRVSHTGFGFVLHKIDALKHFTNRDAQDLYRGPVAISRLLPCPPFAVDWHERAYCPAFDLAQQNHVLHGEDVSFCDLWQLADGEIWAAPDVFIQNGGRGGRFADYLERHGIWR